MPVTEVRLRRAKARPRRRGAWVVAKGATGFVVVALLWELGRATGVLPVIAAPSIAAMVGEFFLGFVDGSWLRVLPPTLFAWLGGLAVAVVLGAALGALTGASTWFSAGSGVVFGFLRPVPPVALVPVAILALGLGPSMVLSLVAFGCIWPVLFNTMYAFREMPVEYVETARMLGYGRIGRFFRVELPAVLPAIVTGVRIAAGIGLVVTVSVELIVGASGLGGDIVQSRATGNIASAYAGILMGGLLGVSIVGIVGLAQRRALRWSPENRRSHG
ncbi:ABC transporter permease [Microbacterium sp. RD1]|uniref:ABC transporter permease n=1 Tax=Microbacterium sp. RD1 TaxID=3457313 RepID=UPI003FA56ED7